MIYSLSEIENIRKSEEENREKLRAKIKEIGQKIMEEKELMRNAAGAGRIEEYQKHNETLKQQEVLLEATREFYEASKNGSVVKKEDILNTWSEFVKKYNKKYDKVYAEYEKARKEAAQKYYELAHMMTMALEYQKKCADLADIKSGGDCGWAEYQVFESAFMGQCHKLEREPISSDRIVCPRTEFGSVNLPNLISVPILYFLTHGDISNDQAVECCGSIDRNFYQSDL